MDNENRPGNIKVRYYLDRRTPRVSANIRGSGGLLLLDTACLDWLIESRLSALKKARRSGNHWTSWGEVVYVVGTPGFVHLSESPHHYEDLGDFVTITESQFDRILADFEKFKSDRIEFERRY